MEELGRKIIKADEFIVRIDGSGNPYIDVSYVRVTYIPADHRKPEANWAGCDVLRIQAYKNDDSNAVFPGAEFPLKDWTYGVELAKSILHLTETEKSKSDERRKDVQSIKTMEELLDEYIFEHDTASDEEIEAAGKLSKWLLDKKMSLDRRESEAKS